jgi:hypothetical protein
MKSSDKWALGLTGVTLFTGGILIAFKELGYHGQDSIQLAVLTIYGAGSLGFLVKLWGRLVDHDDKLTKMQSTIDQQTLVSFFASRLIRTHDVVQRIGLSTFKSQLSSLSGMDNGFRINATNWAMRANTDFWRQLKDFNSERIANHNLLDAVKEKVHLNNKLTCYVVHSGSPLIWQEPDAFASLKEQQNFSAHGKIERIIVGDQEIREIAKYVADPNLPDHSEKSSREINTEGNKNDIKIAKPQVGSARDYAKLMDAMEKHAIKTYYIKGEEEDFGSDFALVEVSENRCNGVEAYT